MNTGYIAPDSVTGNYGGTYSSLASINGQSAYTSDVMIGFAPTQQITLGSVYFTAPPANPNIFFGVPYTNQYNYYNRHYAGTTMINDYDASHWDNRDKLKFVVTTTIYADVYQWSLSLTMTFPIFAYLPESNMARISGMDAAIYVRPNIVNMGGYWNINMYLDYAAVAVSYDSTSGFFFALG